MENLKQISFIHHYLAEAIVESCPEESVNEVTNMDEFELVHELFEYASTIADITEDLTELEMVDGLRHLSKAFWSQTKGNKILPIGAFKLIAADYWTN